MWQVIAGSRGSTRLPPPTAGTFHFWRQYLPLFTSMAHIIFLLLTSDRKTSRWGSWFIHFEMQILWNLDSIGSWHPCKVDSLLQEILDPPLHAHCKVVQLWEIDLSLFLNSVSKLTVKIILISGRFQGAPPACAPWGSDSFIGVWIDTYVIYERVLGKKTWIANLVIVYRNCVASVSQMKLETQNSKWNSKLEIQNSKWNSKLKTQNSKLKTLKLETQNSETWKLKTLKLETLKLETETQNPKLWNSETQNSETQNSETQNSKLKVKLET